MSVLNKLRDRDETTEIAKTQKVQGVVNENISPTSRDQMYKDPAPKDTVILVPHLQND